MYTDTINTNNEVLKGAITSAVAGIVESYPYCEFRKVCLQNRMIFPESMSA